MKARKILVSLAALALVAAISIGGTLAYLTSTQSVKNTFTVGNIQMTLTETDITKDDGSRTDNGNAYKLYPGQTYPKDPVATIKKGSEKCYVRMLVTVENIDKLKDAMPSEYVVTDKNGKQVFLLEKLVGGWDNKVWQYVNYTEAMRVAGEDTIQMGVYEFRYVKDGGIVDAAEAEQVLPALFATITVPGTVDNTHLAMLGEVEINVTAQAMQQEGFDNANAAWTAFESQN